MVVNRHRHDFFRLLLSNDIFIEKFVNLKRKKNEFCRNANEGKPVTFRGDGGGRRFFTLSSFVFFWFSFSERTTKKWLHLSHLTNLVDAKNEIRSENNQKRLIFFQNLQTKLSTCVQISPHFGHKNVILPEPSLPPAEPERKTIKFDLFYVYFYHRLTFRRNGTGIPRNVRTTTWSCENSFRQRIRTSRLNSR